MPAYLPPHRGASCVTPLRDEQGLRFRPSRRQQARQWLQGLDPGARHSRATLYCYTNTKDGLPHSCITQLSTASYHQPGDLGYRGVDQQNSDVSIKHRGKYSIRYFPCFKKPRCYWAFRAQTKNQSVSQSIVRLRLIPSCSNTDIHILFIATPLLAGRFAQERRRHFPLLAVIRE